MNRYPEIDTIELKKSPPSDCYVSFNPYDPKFSEEWHKKRAAGPMWEVYINNSSIVASTFDPIVAEQFDCMLRIICDRLNIKYLTLKGEKKCQ